MRVLRPVVWSKGAFLTQQHFQLQDRFLESTLQFRLEALSIQPWGFHKIAVDQDKLATGTFVLHFASGLMQDGCPFEIPEADNAPAAKSLVDFFGPDHTKVTVYLALPAYRPHGANLSAAERGLETRYVASVANLRDENSGSGERAIQVARKNFRIIAEGESMRGSIALPVARVEMTADGRYQLDPTFVPPLLSFAASDFLMLIARRLLELLTAKSGQLSGLRRQKNQSLADFTTADIANFWLLYTVNSVLPGFRHLFETKRGHPRELFFAMLGLASTLTTFSLKTQPRDLPLYDHDDLGPCFRSLDEQLRFLLETVVPSNFVSLALKPIGPSIYAASLFEDRFLDNTRLYLAISSEMNEGELINKVPHLVKVCSADHIEHLVQRALPGVPLTHVPVPPSSIPIKMNQQYFSLSRSGHAWTAVERARNLAAYVPADFPSPQIELLVVLPQ